LSLLDRIKTARGSSESRMGVDGWISNYLIPGTFQHGGVTYPMGLQGTLGGQRAMEITQTLPGHTAALKACPPAFAAQDVRAAVVSGMRFCYRYKPGAKPSNRRPNVAPRRKFFDARLALLDNPWPGGTTSDLASRMEWHAGLGGAAFVVRRQFPEPHLQVLRPDWCALLYGSQTEPDNPAHALDGEFLGTVYWNGGPNGPWGYGPEFLLPDECIHWIPKPDPLNEGMGMSWLTPAIRDIQSDVLAGQHKIKYWENGAPQPLDAKILTATGWSTMGEMAPGERVIGSDGKPHEVLAVYPQGIKQIFRVEFTDGSAVRCTEDHLWTVVRNRASISERSDTLPLSAMLTEGVRFASGMPKFSIPYVDPVEYDEAGDLPIHPYVLGTLMGDGYLGEKSVSLAAHTDDAGEQERLLKPLLPVGTQMVRRDREGFTTEWNLRGTGNVNLLMRKLRDLGLAGQRHANKAIPEAYLRGSVTERLALLAGLMDTDGSAEGPAARFTTTSSALAQQVADLALGLGGRAVVKSVKKQGLPQWSVLVSRLPEWMIPFRLDRKIAKYHPAKRVARFRHIANVVPEGFEEAQCIAVDSSDHLYVTDGYVLTHNTPNLVVKGIPAVTREQFDELVEMMEERHAGAANAFKTLYLTAGADATIIGNNFQEMDFRSITAAGETRIAMLSRVPATILQISEGLQGSSLNAGNFTASRRTFADTWVYQTLADISASLAPLFKAAPDAELWFDSQDIPLLREDGKDQAEIDAVKANAIRTLVDGGFDPETAVATIAPEWLETLDHTGNVSVQLQPPGAGLANSNEVGQILQPHND
jgi:hypothetical protein